MSTNRVNSPSPEEWLEVRSAFERYLELSPAEQERYLKELSKTQPALYAEVESLAAATRGGGGKLFETPLAADLINATPDITPTGAWLGRYLLLRKLGEGGMAEVYLAKAWGPGDFERWVAVKRVLPHYSSDPDFRSLFEFEAKLSSLLSHSNIVHLYDFWEADGSCLLVMEYVDGKNLAQTRKKLRELRLSLPLECAVYIVKEACRGLEYAHTRKDDRTGAPLNIVHRDVNPKNIMISYEGEVKIVDFGIAKAKNRVRATQTGSLRGTPGYFSPEVTLGESADRRSDVFSAGIILFELLSGDDLFRGEDIPQMLRQIQECRLPAIQVTALPVDDELKQILLKALAKHPRDRYQSAGDFQDDLQRYLSQRSSSDAQKKLALVMQREYAAEITEEKAWREKVIPFPPRLPEKSPRQATPSQPVTRPRRGMMFAVALFVVGVALLLGYRYQTLVWESPQPSLEPSPDPIETPVIARNVEPVVSSPTPSTEPTAPIASPALEKVIKRSQSAKPTGRRGLEEYKLRLIAPGDGSYQPLGRRVVLRWSPIPLRDISFLVEVADDAEFKSPTSARTTKSTFYIETLQPGKYYWRVRAEWKGKTSVSPTGVFHVFVP